MSTGFISGLSPLMFSALSAKTTNRYEFPFTPLRAPEIFTGYLVKEAQYQIVIWNGKTTDVVLSSILSDEQAEGILWNIAPPKIIRARDSSTTLVTVTVTMEGLLEFDAYISFLSTCEFDPVLRIHGSRAPQLAGDVGYLFLSHNWQNGFDERLEWKTDVLIAHDRTEQRIQLRTLPRRAWYFRYLLSGAMRRKFETWIGLRKTRYLFSPVWRDEGNTLAPIDAGSSTVAVKTEHLDYAVGRWIAAYDSWDHMEIREIVGLGPEFVAVAAPFNEDWPAGSRVAPCRYGVCLEQRRINRFTEVVADFHFRFEAQHESAMPTFDPTLYRTVPLCPAVPTWVDPEETLDNKWVRLDNDTGLIEYDIQSIEPVIRREVRFLLIGRPAIDTILRFLFYCAGRLSPFWIPGNDRGFEVAVPALADAVELVIEPMDYEYALSGSPERSHIEMITTGGTIIRRMITGVQTLPSGLEQWTLDSALPVDVEAATLNRCAWLEQCRLDSDAVDLHWVSPECLELTLPLMVLP